MGTHTCSYTCKTDVGRMLKLIGSITSQTGYMHTKAQRNAPVNGGWPSSYLFVTTFKSKHKVGIQKFM